MQIRLRPKTSLTSSPRSRGATNILILQQAHSAAERLFYLRATAAFGWTRNVLLNMIRARTFERSREEGKAHNFASALPENLAEQAQEALKSSYNLDFLGVHKEFNERELERSLVDRVTDFMLELGYGFCFIGRQYRLEVGDQKELREALLGSEPP